MNNSRKRGLKSVSRHNRLVGLIAQELKERGYEPIMYEEYGKPIKGEIDLYAKRGEYVLLFEMKSEDSSSAYRHAIQQLDRAEKYRFPYKRVHKFYVTYENNTPKIKWVRRDARWG